MTKEEQLCRWCKRRPASNNPWLKDCCGIGCLHEFERDCRDLSEYGATVVDKEKH